MIKSSLFRRAALAAVAVSGVAIIAIADSPVNLTASLKPGKLQLKSAGALAFGPDGVLFIGDSLGGSVTAIDTGDRAAAAKGEPAIDVEDLDTKIAAMVGAPADQIVINDMKVNPLSGNVYLSASRGKGPDALGCGLQAAGHGVEPRQAVGPGHEVLPGPLWGQGDDASVPDILQFLTRHVFRPA